MKFSCLPPYSFKWNSPYLNVMFCFILLDSNRAAKSKHCTFGGPTLTRYEEHSNPESDMEMSDLPQKSVIRPLQSPDNMQPG